MSFTLSLERAWQRASHLTGPEDLVPSDAMRLLANCRLDRVRGTISSRPGMLQLTFGAVPVDAAFLTVLHLTKLFAAVADFAYVQVTDNSTSKIYRLLDWGGAPSTPLASGLPITLLSEVDFVDGFSVPHKFMVGPLLKKDNGTTFSNFGVTPPPLGIANATLGTRLRSVMGSFNTATGWTSTGTGPLAVDTNMKQQDTASLTFTVAADTLGSVTKILGSAYSVFSGISTGAANVNYIEDLSVDFTTIPVFLGSEVDVQGVTEFQFIVTRITQHRLYFDGPTTPPGNLVTVGSGYFIIWNASTFQTVQATGINTAATASTVSLTDSTKDFRRLGVVPGMTVWNTNDGASGIITSLGQTTTPNDTLHFTAGLSGGNPNSFRPGDGYLVVNNLVANDDWIHFWVLADYPDRLEYVQLDLGFDPPGIVGTNFFSYRISPNQLNTGAAQWTELFLRKSAFERFGQSTVGWNAITWVRTRVQTDNTVGGVTVWLNGLSIDGGYGIEGTMHYAAVYANEVTGGLSAPAKFDEVAFYTTPILAARHRVLLDLTNINSASLPAPDSQVTHIWIYRYGGNILYPGTFVQTVPITTATFLDTYADVQLDDTRTLEVDNDPPPSDLKVIFGPGATQRLFGIHQRNRVRFSKQWEVNRSRGENWPITFEFQIGDGSQVAVNGVITDQAIHVYSDSSTFEVQGQGPDAYLAVPVIASHGLAAQEAVTEGDGQIFFLASDGIYDQVGVVQQKLTGAIDPFFLRTPVNGQLPLNQDRIGLCKLEWYQHPTDPELVLLYPEQGSQTLNKRLVLKKNPQTGRYTDCYFDQTAGFNLQCVYVDPRHLVMVAGSDTGRIYQLEVESTTTDDTSPISGRARQGARVDGASQNVKSYSDAVIEANTGGVPMAVIASFNRSTASQALPPIVTLDDTTIIESIVDQSVAPSSRLYRNIALDLSWTSSTRVTLYSLGWHVQLEAEGLTFVDTGPITFPLVEAGKWLTFDIDSQATTTVTVSIDGAVRDTRPLFLTNGRQRRNHYLPPGLKGREWRITVSAVSPFLLYDLGLAHKPWGKPVGYAIQSVLSGRAG